MALRAGLGQPSASLALLDPPGCAALWSSHTDRMLAFFEQPWRINHEHGMGIAQRLDHRGPSGFADLLGIPLGTPQHMLDAIRCRITNDCGDLPPIFPLDGAQEAPQICPHPTTGVAAGKVWQDTAFHCGQP